MNAEAVAGGGCDPADERRSGRPRSAAADEAILAATMAELTETGYDGLTIEAVAERAEVAKTTIYRRYQSKQELVVGALTNFQSVDEPVAYSDSLAADLLRMARRLRDKFASGEVGRLIPNLTDAASRHPELREMHHEYIRMRRRPATERVMHAVEHGQLPADTDVELVVDQVVGPIYYRTYLSGQSLDDDVLRALIRRSIGSD